MNNNQTPAEPTALKRHADGLREALFAQLERLSKNPSFEEIAVARAVNDTAGSLIQLAKVEVEYLKAVDGKTSQFLGPAGMKLSTVHRLEA